MTRNTTMGRDRAAHELALDVECLLHEAYSVDGVCMTTLARYGEELRRVVAAGARDGFARAVLAQYDAELCENLRWEARELLHHGDVALVVALDDLLDREAGAVQLMLADESLGGLAAAYRAGLLSADVVWAAGRRAAEFAEAHAAQLVHLREAAATRRARFGDDPELPGLYAYLDALSV